MEIHSNRSSVHDLPNAPTALGAVDARPAKVAETSSVDASPVKALCVVTLLLLLLRGNVIIVRCEEW